MKLENTSAVVTGATSGLGSAAARALAARAVRVYGLDVASRTTPNGSRASPTSGPTSPMSPRYGTRYGLELGGAALVRPDSVIAWRSSTAVANPAYELDEALTAILALTPVSSVAQ